jgi:hypothetical protein
MKNLTDVRWIKAKGLLFLFLGLLCVTLVLLEHISLRVELLMMVAVWSFCRFYYFAFYVIEHYTDPTYRFSGLISFAVYLIRNRSSASGRVRDAFSGVGSEKGRRVSTRKENPHPENRRVPHPTPS